MGSDLPDIAYSDRAGDQLADLETETAERIVSKLDDVVWNPEHYLRRLQGPGQADYRLRIGDYRALIDWRRDDGVLFVIEVGHRRNIYD